MLILALDIDCEIDVGGAKLSGKLDCAGNLVRAHPAIDFKGNGAVRVSGGFNRLIIENRIFQRGNNLFNCFQVRILVEHEIGRYAPFILGRRVLISGHLFGIVRPNYFGLVRNSVGVGSDGGDVILSFRVPLMERRDLIRKGLGRTVAVDAINNFDFAGIILGNFFQPILNGFIFVDMKFKIAIVTYFIWEWYCGCCSCKSLWSSPEGL